MRKFSNITEEQAAFIKDLRINKGFSWRAVAREFSEKYPNEGVHSENQIDGIDLCDAAMWYFNEQCDDGWN